MLESTLIKHGPTKRVWVFDLETLPEIFTATFLDRDSNDTRTFVISSTKDERIGMFEFLSKEVAGLVGYNSLHFDAQILEYMYKNPTCTVTDISKYCNVIISGNRRRPDVPEWKLRDKHLDLFRALSLSTSAKRTGLKWCEFMMDLENIEDMPEERDEASVLRYNLNDVVATKELYLRYMHETELRKSMTRREGINLMNSTEPDLSKKLFGKYLSKAMGISTSELNEMHTTRDVVKVKDILFPYIQFKTEKFNHVLEAFRKLELKEGDAAEFVVNKGIDIVFGLGGIHAAPNKTVVESDKEYIIKSLDFVSWYPNLMIRNGLCPAHIPKEIFLPLYESLFNERRAIPKSNPRNYILKILLNATYGLTNDQYSFLRDRAVTLGICINGQLGLMMVFEELLESIPKSQLIMLNTDGGEIRIPREYEKLYKSICEKYVKLFKTDMEFVDYDKMVIENVNNYISIDTTGKVKTKGRYEYKDIPLHKNKSHSIIPRAVHDYWVKGIPVEKTIKEHTNIFDFCAGIKSSKTPEKGQSSYEMYKVEKGVLTKKKLSKTVRYFISKKGGTLIKQYEDGSFAQVEAPIMKGKKLIKEWKTTYFNQAYKADDYDLDYSYYIYHAKNWINDIQQIGQTKLL